ncbi:MAG: hypothetical protein RQ757_08150 [Pseudomonadales bacterium]|nr:hypothetical protein [Pseudomonadales bacterium]
MNFNRNKLAVALAFASFSLSLQAAEPVLTPTTLSGAATNASFSGGATTDASATFVTTIDANTAFDVVGTINVDPADVGKQGGMVVVVDVPNLGAFLMLSGGFFVPWDGQESSLRPFAKKALPAKEKLTVFDDLVGQYSNLQGLNFNVFMGYYADNLNNLAFTETPIRFSISNNPAPLPAADCPATTTKSANQFENKDVCILNGTITADTHLTSNNVYLLDGAVFIGGDNTDSATLSIDAGTKIISPVGLNFLVINRGSKIEANGTASAPITFTYDDEANATPTTTGRWGGIIINGNAPVNGCAVGTVLCELEGEGSTGLYGGNNPTDNSGVLNYVVVKYPGQNITETNELNGIAFQGVGSGTVVSNVQVHGSSDDGVEFFGGTVNAKNLVLTSNEDDSFDWTFGWRGKVQNVIIQQRENFGDRGIEADNNEFNFDSLPRSKPTLANFTMIGKGSGNGITLRRGTGANISNFVVLNSGTCLNLNDDATFTNGGSSATSLTGELTITHSRLACSTPFGSSANAPWSVADWFNNQAGNSLGSVSLNGFVNTDSVNALPAAAFSDPFFDQVDHIGAIKNAQSDWAASWIFQD